MPTMTLRRGLLLFSALGSAFLAASAQGDDDHEAHERGRRRAARASATLDGPMKVAYVEECGGCHLAYPPGLLPARSWTRLLEGLGDHFEQNAELDPDTRRQLLAWLQENAAEAGTHAKSAKVLRSLEGTAPLRLTDTPYLRRQHDELRPAVFARKSIGSRANCVACHRGAERWEFDEDAVRVPRR